jgi:hypothetical protein
MEKKAAQTDPLFSFDFYDRPFGDRPFVGPVF